VNQYLYEKHVTEDARYGGLIDGEAIGLEKGRAEGLGKVVVGSHRSGFPGRNNFGHHRFDARTGSVSPEPEWRFPAYLIELISSSHR
jgi:hypothetical protein